jgi:hypothetical protein
MVATAIGTAHAEAQSVTDSLGVEIVRLAALVDSLSREVARLQGAGQEVDAEDALAQLRAAAQAAAAAGGGAQRGATPADQEFVGRQRSLQALNPEISVNADGFAQVNKDATGQDNFFMRAFEIAIVSNLDPFSRAKFFFVRGQEAGTLTPFETSGPEEEKGGSFVAEEAFIEWVGLPGGFGLKFGRFFQQFGQLNRWHQHALPVQSRSLPHIAFLGQEALGGTGLSLHWLLPTGGGSGTYETTWEIARKENENLYGSAGGVSLLGNFNAFWNLSAATDLDVSVNWISGGYADGSTSLDRDLFAVEGAFSWRPPARARYSGLVLRGGYMALRGLLPVDADGTGASGDEAGRGVARGAWTAGEVRLNQSWLAGARLDWAQNPLNTNESAWLVAPTLTWWQSEYVRLRLEYDLLGRSASRFKEGRLLFQIVFAVGPHKHETY